MTENMSSSNTTTEKVKKPTVMCCIGMAGSGKTTFIQRVNAYLNQVKKPTYLINLDPATTNSPFAANIDIRDTVDYKQVMKQYNLGPNGGILTALNLFTTKFDQVLEYLDKRSAALDYVLLDTPGQIEIFTWSASGSIITESLASTFPTVICYIIDTPRSTSPATFMSNMLYACSILYKTKLPFVLVFNKCDVTGCEFAVEWMSDFEVFQEALKSDTTYMGTLVNSMCLVLEEFYTHLKVVGVSAISGSGMPELFEAINEAAIEYETDYKPEIELMIKARDLAKQAQKQDNLAKLMKDMSV